MELQKTIDQAIDILRRWKLGDTHFTLTTSGSTGEPSDIEHTREALQWSAESTLNMWFTSSDQPEENTPIAPIQLCILPLNKAGGFMQLIRSAVWESPLWIGPASSNPFFDAQGSKSHQTPSHLEIALMLDGEVLPYNTELWNRYKPNILSITPMQLQLALKSQTGREILNQMHTVLIGGQAMDLQLEKQILGKFPNTRWIHTFGSTETASHFAGRILNQNTPEYTLTAGSSLTTNETGEIQISNPATNGRRITLHDKIQMTSDTTFIWLERTNLLVNSGGVKIPIEPLEKEISSLLNWPLLSFYIAGQPHPILGEELTLFTSHAIEDMQHITETLAQLPKLHQPKKILYIPEIPVSENGKLIRKINP
jgi:O-succinylbenzoic acid--CoA ligase